MGFRPISLRHGRSALAAAPTPSSLRTLITTSRPPTTLTADPPPAPTPAPPSPRWHPPASPTTAAAPPPDGSAYAIAPRVARAAPLKSIKPQWKDRRARWQRHRKIGADVEQLYSPMRFMTDPPRPADVTLEMLMAAQTHMGHHRSLWNPANSRYIYGVRQGIHIISLEQTAAHLRRAARLVDEVAFQGGLVLFAGTRRGHMPIVARAAELAGGCSLFDRWTPGAITNRDLILGSRPLRVVDEHDRPMRGFDTFTSGQRPLVPDLVVCLNPRENFVMLYECGLASIPTVGVIDTNTEPSWVTYAIPANDDSLRSLAVIAGVLGRAGQAGRERRLESARQGRAPWRTSQKLWDYLASVKEDKAQMAQMERYSEGEGAGLAGPPVREEEEDLEAILLGLEEGNLEVTEDDMLQMLSVGAGKVERIGESEDATVTPARPMGERRPRSDKSTTEEESDSAWESMLQETQFGSMPEPRVAKVKPKEVPRRAAAAAAAGSGGVVANIEPEPVKVVTKAVSIDELELIQIAAGAIDIEPDPVQAVGAVLPDRDTAGSKQPTEPVQPAEVANIELTAAPVVETQESVALGSEPAEDGQFAEGFEIVEASQATSTELEPSQAAGTIHEAVVLGQETTEPERSGPFAHIEPEAVHPNKPAAAADTEIEPAQAVGIVHDAVELDQGTGPEQPVATHPESEPVQTAEPAEPAEPAGPAAAIDTELQPIQAVGAVQDTVDPNQETGPEQSATASTELDPLQTAAEPPKAADPELEPVQAVGAVQDAVEIDHETGPEQPVGADTKSELAQTADPAEATDTEPESVQSAGNVQDAVDGDPETGPEKPVGAHVESEPVQTAEPAQEANAELEPVQAVGVVQSAMELDTEAAEAEQPTAASRVEPEPTELEPAEAAAPETSTSESEGNPSERAGSTAAEIEPGSSQDQSETTSAAAQEEAPEGVGQGVSADVPAAADQPEQEAESETSTEAAESAGAEKPSGPDTDKAESSSDAAKTVEADNEAETSKGAEAKPEVAVHERDSKDGDEKKP